MLGGFLDGGWGVGKSVLAGRSCFLVPCGFFDFFVLLPSPTHIKIARAQKVLAESINKVKPISVCGG